MDNLDQQNYRPTEQKYKILIYIIIGIVVLSFLFLMVYYFFFRQKPPLEELNYFQEKTQEEIVEVENNNLKTEVETVDFEAEKSDNSTIAISEKELINNQAEEIIPADYIPQPKPDKDGDGLPDDEEKFYGTDENNPDSDGDGYSDGQEVKSGFNPLGPGREIKIFTP